MNQHVIINDSGVYLKKERIELMKVLCKKATEIWYRSQPRRFNSELDVLLLYLWEAEMIQVYKTGVVRIFLKHERIEEKTTIFLNKLPRDILEIICE